MSTPDLWLGWCSYAAATYAVRHWHYSRRMPRYKLARVGVWECGWFAGAVVFGDGATPELFKPYGLDPLAGCELVRVALKPGHRAPVSRVVAVALRLLKAAQPGLRLVVSFADAAQGHRGGIYQAGNWVYTGGEHYHAYRVRGVLVHPKTLHSRYGTGGQSIPWLRAHVDPAAERVVGGFKHRYLYPLDAAMRQQIGPLAQPYPRRASGESDTPPSQGGEGAAMRPHGSIPLEAAG